MATLIFHAILIIAFVFFLKKILIFFKIKIWYLGFIRGISLKKERKFLRNKCEQLHLLSNGHFNDLLLQESRILEMVEPFKVFEKRGDRINGFTIYLIDSKNKIAVFSAKDSELFSLPRFTNLLGKI